MATLNIKTFPEDLYIALVELAKSEHRSLTQEVIYLLQLSVEKRNPSILKLRGLGKEAWKEIDPNTHIQNERDSWE